MSDIDICTHWYIHAVEPFLRIKDTIQKDKASGSNTMVLYNS